MTADTNMARDNLIGLTLLLLLAVALIVDERREDAYLASPGFAAPTTRPALVIDDSAIPATIIRGDIAGAIRELEVRPLSNRSWPDLGWSTDAPSPEENRGLGF